MMTTLDGKITSGTGVDILDDYFSLYTKVEDRLNAKSWMFGRVTMEAFAEDLPVGLPTTQKDIDDTDYFLSTQSDYNVFAIDTKGVLRWKDNTIKLANVDERINIIVIVTQKTPKDYLAYLQDNKISYIYGGKDAINFDLLFKKIKSKLGIDKILLEGGGILNGSVMNENLIDEISLLLLPIVVNRVDAPSIFEGEVQQILNIKKYSLTKVERIENDVVWLKYKRKFIN
jgi:riboflavin biosynthesis pyrimidine reductase